MPSVGVIGAGISGLAAAYQLSQTSASVHVLEAADRVGGVIRSDQGDGFLVEHGPNSIRAGAAALETIIDDLDLHHQRIWANDDADTRYVVRDGQPTPLPRSVRSFLTSNLFSTRAKLRLLAEPFLPRAGTSEESVAQFTRRRLGPEILDYAVAPFVGGVFTGAPEDLSVRHAFHRLAELEDEYGSLFLGALRRVLAKSNDETQDAPSGLFSFRDGVETLPGALADALGDRISLRTDARALHHDGDRWKVTLATDGEQERTRLFDALICTVPLHRLTTMDLELSVDRSPLETVSYPPVSILALGFPQEAVDHPLDGFGLLVPPVEARYNILGTIFSSTLFPNRAPDDSILLTTFVGGARAPTLATPDTAALQSLVKTDLNKLLSVTGDPIFRHHVHWPHAIPQYTLGYGQVKDTLNTIEERHPTLAFAGNYRAGVSVGDALTSGLDAADRLLDRLG